MLLWIAHHPVHTPLHLQDRSVLSEREFVFTTASPAVSRGRVGLREFFAIEFALITDIADEESPPWLDYRGPPGSRACSHDYGHSLQGCRPGGQPKGSHFHRNSGPPVGKFERSGFATAFS